MSKSDFRQNAKSFNDAVTEVNIRLSSLVNAAALVVDTERKAAILRIVDEYSELSENLLKPVEFLYNFESGGWNSQNALHIDEALKLANARWAGSKTLKIKKDSFRISSSDEVTNLLNTFN